MTSRKDWIQNRMGELALEKTGHEFRQLGSHMQLMCYAIAEQNWIDYYSDLIDSTYECEKHRLLGIDNYHTSMIQ